jgi:hypothetical protein
LHVRREAVEVSLEVLPKLLLVCAGPEVAQRELRCVVDGLTGCITKWSVLVDDAFPVEKLLHLEYGRLRGFEYGVEPAKNCHRQDYVPILATHIEVTQHVVGDVPDETRYACKLSGCGFSLFDGRQVRLLLRSS